MPEAVRFPTKYLAAIQHTLAQLLNGYVSNRQVPRCLLAFVDEGGAIRVPLSLKTDADWAIVFARTTEGLIGRALQTGNIEHAKKGEFKEGDPRTVYEIAAQITFQDAPTAVLLIDYFEGEQHLNPGQDGMITTWRREISDVLRSFESRERGLRDQIFRVTEVCVNETDSLRGYTAFKRWDGTLIYVTVGKDRQKFEYFSQLEGICGEAIRSGVFQNLGNVWDSPHYRSSDNEIASEAVAPIIVAGETIGVLNMEAVLEDNYSEERVARMKEHATELGKLCLSYRETVYPEIGSHSLLLSDLIEQFGFLSPHAGQASDDHDVVGWAVQLLQSKIRQIASIAEIQAMAGDPGAAESPRFADEYPPPTRITLDDHDRPCARFDVWKDGENSRFLKVVFSSRPDLATLEIIGQFCRLTFNEIKRRIDERRSLEFEKLVSSIKGAPEDASLHRILTSLKRMLECDHVTYFSAERAADGRTILVPAITTADEIGFQSKDRPFYEASVSSGLTGYAATLDDVLLIKNVLDERELAAIDVNLKWSKNAYEDKDISVRSFFAIPLFRADGLMGVIRGHRSVERKNVPFTGVDRERLRLVKFLFERVLDRDVLESAADA